MDLRFDDAYESVYEFNEDQNAYVFIGRYFKYGINVRMSDEEKNIRVNAVEED